MRVGYVFCCCLLQKLYVVSLKACSCIVIVIDSVIVIAVCCNMLCGLCLFVGSLCVVCWFVVDS